MSKPVVHIKTGKVLSNIRQSKVKLNGVWENAVIYECSGMEYVRLYSDFEKNTQ